MEAPHHAPCRLSLGPGELTEGAGFGTAWHRYGSEMEAPEVLKTARLRLRRPAADDAETIFSTYAQDPEVTRYLTWEPHQRIDQTRAFLARCVRVWDEGTSYPYAITLSPSGRLIGAIEARVDEHRVELGFVLARNEWGKGFATEAASQVIEWALSQPPIWRVWACTDVDNDASGRVLEKAGMSREGLLRSWASHPNVSSEPRDCWSYAKSREHQ